MDMESYLRFVLALLFVLGLILGGAWLARRAGLGSALKPGRKRRLALVEALPVDGKRRLVLVRRDGKEHLLLVGGGTDVIVEGDIAADSAPPQEEKRS